MVVVGEHVGISNDNMHRHVRSWRVVTECLCRVLESCLQLECGLHMASEGKAISSGQASRWAYAKIGVSTGHVWCESGTSVHHTVWNGSTARVAHDYHVGVRERV